MTDRARAISIGEMQKLIEAFCSERDWRQFHGLKDEALSLLVEAGELAEHFRWHDESTLRAKLASESGAVADELADVLYWTLLLANDLDIDLTAAFARKMLVNEKKYPVGRSKGRTEKHRER